ncbi:MAG TPA: response regulator transcription factor [Flavobacteriaceae bacterium]|nr:response regulator transcription factor [Flavobacteriaceae bacterium]HPF10853.1 response regulator transcription factor [Flavobacteriaceae bacterium]HQU22192.1 response regulator transcription factor [Flavobacteriaceae bacterium]HQU65573.1 response regulator transcription factor [Flavobacteriaceae bacterium]HRW44490.1 response regulator transcription factor [Flavobacteriaceae bacterium]
MKNVLNDKIHIAIVEDDPEIRQTLSLIIDGSQGFVCKHVFPDGESAIKGIKDIPVDVVLMDIDLPGISGIEATRLMKREHPKMDFIMLTVQSDDDSIFESLCVGASGYLLKDTNPADLLVHIREVFEGGSPMSSQIARRIINSFRIIENPLSDRETEVLKNLSKGFNYKEIAEEMYLSPHTVKTHIKNIYGKLHVNNRAEAIYKAIKQKLI